MVRINSSGFMGWRDAIAIMLLVVTFVFTLWHSFDPGRSFALHMDNEFFIGTVLSAMSDAFKSGEWPLRMTTALGGLPLYNLTQVSSFYPFYFTSLPLFETPMDVATSMHWITLLHVMIFAINMFILLRVIGTTRLAAVTGASLVAFGVNSVAIARWLGIIAPYAWLPLYLAGLIAILEGRTSAKYPAMAVAGIVLLVLASPSQPLIHAVLLTIVLGLFRWWHNHKNALDHATSASLIKLCAIAVVAFLLSAPAILPALIEFKEMIRWIGPFPAVVGHARIPFDAFLIDQLSLTELGGVLVEFSRKAVGSTFIGPVAATLAVFALIGRPRSWIVIAMAVIALYSLASSAGSNLGLAYVNYNIPLLNKIREPSRFLFLFQLAIGILAALGIDALRKMVVDVRRLQAWRQQAAIVIIIALTTVVVAFGLRNHGAELPPAFIASLMLVSLLAFSIFVARTSWHYRGEIIGLSWAVAAFVVLVMNVNWKPPPIASSTYLAKDGIALDVVIKRIVEMDPQHDYRLIFEGSIDKQMAAMLASYQSVRTLNSYFNPAPLRQFNELYNHGPRTDNYLQILGARYLICRDCSGVKYRGFKFLESLHDYDIHEALDALPYVQLAQRLDGRFESLPDFVAQASGNDLSRGLLFVDKAVNLKLTEKKSEAGDCIIRNDIRKKNRIRYLVDCKFPAVLILNEFYSDSWHASINGMSVNKLRVNGNQIGVHLSQGGQIVELTYLPTIFILSIALAVMGVALVLLWVLRIYKRSRVDVC